MTQRPALEEVFAAWRKQSTPLPRAPSHAGSDLVANALAQVQGRRQRRAWGRRLALSCAAAAVLLGLGASLWEGGRRSALHGSPAAEATLTVALNEAQGEVSVSDAAGGPVSGALALPEGYGVRTEQGSATLGFPSGAAARVSRRSSLRLTATRETEALLLSQGRVDVEVPKLDPRRGFAVQTPDAQVIVHGTGFSVSVDPAATGIHTQVDVTHGVVSVRHAGAEVRLTAGQHWPASSSDPDLPAALLDVALPHTAQPDEAVPDTAPAAAETGETPASGAAAKRKARSNAQRARESRELAEQNGHFARAMTLKNQGRSNAALAELAHLLSSHPTSPLAQEARVERLRVLHGLGHRAQARREARRYLADFPDGYAAAEAQAVLEEAP